MALEEFDGAKPCLQRSADIYNETLGQKHVGTVNPQIGLGDATRLAGNLEEARQILETTLETQESKISSNQGNEYEQTIAVLYHHAAILVDLSIQCKGVLVFLIPRATTN